MTFAEKILITANDTTLLENKNVLLAFLSELDHKICSECRKVPFNQMSVGWVVKWVPKAEPSEILRLGSRWAPNSLPEPCFRRERGLGSETGVKKVGVKNL